ncbi:MAG TPA: hypothetical protein PK156_43580 [Polyangium sp.]|nr:hypothetical protein [Polyangium sp.]
MKNRFAFQTWIAALLLGWTIQARAENQRVLLIHAGASDPITSHLVDELVAAGFSVEIVPTGTYDAAVLAKERSARAVLRVEPGRQGIELWTDTRAAVVRIEEKPEEKGDLATLSLRAVEELRGQLLTPQRPPAEEPSLRLPPIPPGENQQPRTSPVRPHEPDRPRLHVESIKTRGQFWLHVTPSAIVHPGGDGVTAGAAIMIGGRWMFLRHFGADFVGTVPIVPSEVTSPAGNVNIAASSILVGGWADLYRPVPAISWGLGAGAGGGVFHHYGQPRAANFEARDGNVAYALPYARSALSWAISSTVSLRADILAAIATPRPVLRLPGRTADAYFGQPLLLIGLGLDLKLK